MHIDLKSAIVGALASGAITWIAGPIIKTKFVDPFLHEAHWSGHWRTVTCGEGLELRYNVYLDQGSEAVTGSYKGVGRANTIDGVFWAGNLDGKGLAGNWARTDGGSVAGGRFDFVQTNDGEFSGTIANGSRTRIWLGKRGNEFPTCD